MSTKFISAVMAIPVNNQGQFLITQRLNPKNLKWHKKWQVAGGAIEFGESPEQALAREMQEELGVSARIIFPYPICKSISYKRGEDEDTPSKDVHITFACYLVDVGSQKIDTSKDKETGGHAWIDPAQIHTYDCLPLTKDLIEAAAEIVKKFAIIEQIVKT